MMRKNLLIDEISDTWYDLMNDDDNNTALFELIIMKKYEHNLPDVHIPETTIYSRVRRGKTSYVHVTNTMPDPQVCIANETVCLSTEYNQYGERYH